MTLASAEEIEESEEEAQPLPFWPLFSYAILAALTALAYSPRLGAAHLPAGPLVQGRPSHHGRRRHRADHPHGSRRRRHRSRHPRRVDEFPAVGSSPNAAADDDVEDVPARWPIQFWVGLLVARPRPALARSTRETRRSPTCMTRTRLGKPGMAIDGRARHAAPHASTRPPPTHSFWATRSRARRTPR